MKVFAAVMALVVLGSGCSAAPGRPAETSAASVPGQAAPAIPDGVSWSKTLTRADLKAFNVDLPTKEMNWAEDQTLVTILKFSGGAWTQFANYNGGPQQPGDGGTYTYDSARNLVLNSPNGGSHTYQWQVTGDRLALRMVGVPRTSSGDLAVVRMMTEGEYERSEP